MPESISPAVVASIASRVVSLCDFNHAADGWIRRQIALQAELALSQGMSSSDIASAMVSAWQHFLAAHPQANQRQAENFFGEGEWRRSDLS